MLENKVLAFEEALRLTPQTVRTMEKWQTLKSAALAQQSTNSDYAEALKACLDDIVNNVRTVLLSNLDTMEVATRLNFAVKAQQNRA